MPIEGQPIGLRGILRPAVRVMKRSRPAACGPRLRRSERRASARTSTDRHDGVADNATRPGVENHGDINEAHGDGDVSDVGDPELIRPLTTLIFARLRKIGWSAIASAVSPHIADACAGTEIVFAHEALDLLVIDHEGTLLAKVGLHKSPTVAVPELSSRIALIAWAMAIKKKKSSGYN